MEFGISIEQEKNNNSLTNIGTSWEEQFMPLDTT